MTTTTPTTPHKQVVSRLGQILETACSDELHRHRAAIVYDGFDGPESSASVTYAQLALTMTQVNMERRAPFSGCFLTAARQISEALALIDSSQSTKLFAIYSQSWNKTLYELILG